MKTSAKALAGVFGLVLYLLVATATPAHHGRGVGFDAEHPLTLTGSVTRFDWINPHVLLFFDVKDDKGNVRNWGIEWSTPRSLVISGLSKDSLKPGTIVKLRFIPAKSGAPRGEIEQAWDASGKLLFDRDALWPAGYPSR